jgi:diamine N-acetyltransferase
MSRECGDAPLSYRRLRRSELDLITAIDLDPDQVDRFLGPISDIVAAVLRGPAHAIVAIEAGGAFAGFYVVHPAASDPSCWWLGWFAVGRRHQGHGYGGLALQAVLRHLARIPQCQRVRLLVAADNARARRLYDGAGFRTVGTAAGTGELVLELLLPSHVTAAELKSFAVRAAAVQSRRIFSHRRMRLIVGPHPAWVIGVERGPPARQLAGARSALAPYGRPASAHRRRSVSLRNRTSWVISAPAHGGTGTNVSARGSSTSANSTPASGPMWMSTDQSKFAYGTI